MVQIFSIIICLGILVFVVELTRKGALKEKYALLWLVLSILLLVLSIWRGLLDIIAGVFGFYYSPSFLFLLAFGFLLLISLHFSIVISSLNEKNKKLAQDIGIIKEELEQVKKANREEKEE